MVGPCELHLLASVRLDQVPAVRTVALVLDRLHLDLVRMVDTVGALAVFPWTTSDTAVYRKECMGSGSSKACLSVVGRVII